MVDPYSTTSEWLAEFLDSNARAYSGTSNIVSYHLSGLSGYRPAHQTMPAGKLVCVQFKLRQACTLIGACLSIRRNTIPEFLSTNTVDRLCCKCHSLSHEMHAISFTFYSVTLLIIHRQQKSPVGVLGRITDPHFLGNLIEKPSRGKQPSDSRIGNTRELMNGIL